MQHLLDENTYKKLDPSIDSKIQSNLLRFLRKYKMYFTEPDMQHLLDENTYKKLDPSINSKIQSNLLRFLRKYKMYFTEPEWKP